MLRPKQRLALWTIAGIWLLSGILLFLSANAFAQSQASRSTDIYSQLQLFNEVLLKLRQNYVTDLSDEELIQAAIKGMLSSADPHTNFFTPNEFTDFTTSTRGEFGGLGIQIDKKGDYITVVSPIEGTPAYRMGITSGDRIISVDGVSIIGASTDDAISKMRGDIGTKVRITISRPGVQKPLEYEIIREAIKIKSVPYAFVLDNGVGYIRISQFSENTTRELRTALSELETAGIGGLLIDLRWNPGGLLDQAIDTVNEFIGSNKLVVETKGRLPESNRQYLTRFPARERNYPIIVMVNEASASASEIFAGSLQDWDKGLVVGKTTFGKGSVQQLYPLSNGYGAKITTSYYYIKSGRCIHKTINDRILRGQYVTEDEIKSDDETSHKSVYYTVNKRVVYGGGGITPDLVLESDLLTNLGAELRRKNIFFDFAVNYVISHDHQVPKDFQVSQDIFDEFLQYATAQDVKFTPVEVDSAAAFIRNTIRSEIVGKVYGEKEAYKISINQDRQLQEAIALFNRFNTMAQMFEYAASLQARN
ncbi:MAG: S41 family peptidase [Candidatus Cloacimonetes bacterium]|nr:S41 family peptidase [Candidatus Cloacimonadota bacterium]